MLKRVVITNYLGESMEYKIDGVQENNPSGLIITSIDGLGPVKADINMTDLTTTDGQRFNSARLSGRNIVIKALFTHASSIEEARLLSYKYFPIKKKLKIRVETDNRVGETEGYVESNEPDIFSEESSCQISIVCENAYFDGGEVTYVFNDTIPRLQFAVGNESLTEPLIRVSENAESTSTREAVYDGDTDTGMKIEVELPIEDEMDTFKVTGIEILGDDNKKIAIDTAKMANHVPNSAPDGVSNIRCAFKYKYDRYKFWNELPVSDHMWAAVNYNNEIYVVCNRGIFKYDNGWNLVSNWPYGSVSNDMVIYQNKFYIVTGDGLKCWDPSNPTGQSSYGYPDGFIAENTRAVVYDGKIHILGTSSYRDSASRHYTFEEVPRLENPWTRLSDLPYPFCGGGAVVYDNCIHILGGYLCQWGQFPDDGQLRYHYKWDGSEWTSASELPINSETINGFAQPEGFASAVVFENEIHLLFGDGDGSHWAWHTGGEWAEKAGLPININGRGALLDHNGCLYIMSSYSLQAPSYTEEVNNTKLIEGDKLVIDTIKGEKSVTLYRGTNQYNVLNALDKDSTWLQLQRGVNQFSYTAETGADDLQVTLRANRWYEGV